MQNFRQRFLYTLWPWYTAGFVALLGTTYISLAVPKLAKDIVNAIEVKNFDQPMIQNLALVIIVLGFIQILIRSLSRIFLFWPGRQIEMVLKNHLFEHLIRLPETFFERFGMGDLISRVANDVGHIRVMYAFGVLQLLNLILLALFAVSQMLQVHLWLTVTTLSPLLLMLIITRYIMPKMHEFYKINQEVVGRLTNKITEAYVNVHVIKTNAAEPAFLKQVEVENQVAYDINIKLVILRMIVWPLLSSMHNISILVVLFYGGYLVIHELISVGDILAFNLYVALLAFPLTAIGIIIGLYQRAKIAFLRVGEIDTAKIETSNSATPTQSSPYLLELKDLNFGYDKDGLVLNNINFHIQPGQRLGLCGPVGCGKSTLFNLITRIRNPAPGTILFNSKDVLSYEPDDLRRQIAYVEQSARLLSMDIKENLLLGLDKNISFTKIEAATRAAQIYDEIIKFPKQWDTQIGERGLRLSGGQKQRLALARFFLREPKLLILDDVLSAVDHSTEAKLIDYIFSTPCAALIASHRLSALECCDQVLMISEHGKIIAQGPLRELRQKHPDLFDFETEQVRAEGLT